MRMMTMAIFLRTFLWTGLCQSMLWPSNSAADAFVSSASTVTTTTRGLFAVTRGGSSSSDLPYGPPTPTKVLVTGASGRTGQLVFTTLLDDPRFEPVALVRSERSAKKLLKSVINGGSNKKNNNGSKQPKRYCGLDQIVVCDVTKLPQRTTTTTSSSTNDNDSTTATTTKNDDLAAFQSSSLQDCTAMIICTSAVPVLRKRSLWNILWNVPRNFILRKPKLLDFSLLRFGWKQDQYPELVDYYGTLAQIDWAKEHSTSTSSSSSSGGGEGSATTTTTGRSGSVTHVVLVSSMGGTDPSNFLNRVGKNPDGTGNGDILLWKRKAEKYLVESGLDYTIIHPGGLLDTPPGVEELILDVDDVLLQQTKRSISRADVANLCVAALVVGKNKRVSLDCISQPIPTTTTTTATPEATSSDDTAPAAATTTTTSTTTTTPKTAEQVLATFLETRKTANYEL